MRHEPFKFLFDLESYFGLKSSPVSTNHETNSQNDWVLWSCKFIWPFPWSLALWSTERNEPKVLLWSGERRNTVNITKRYWPINPLIDNMLIYCASRFSSRASYEIFGSARSDARIIAISCKNLKHHFNPVSSSDPLADGSDTFHTARPEHVNQRPPISAQTVRSRLRLHHCSISRESDFNVSKI